MDETLPTPRSDDPYRPPDDATAQEASTSTEPRAMGLVPFWILATISNAVLGGFLGVSLFEDAVSRLAIALGATIVGVSAAAVDHSARRRGHLRFARGLRIGAVVGALEQIFPILEFGIALFVVGGIGGATPPGPARALLTTLAVGGGKVALALLVAWLYAQFDPHKGPQRPL